MHQHETNYPDDVRQFDAHPSSPFHEDPPEAICKKCGTGHDAGGFYENWIAELDPEMSIPSQMPKICPSCTPEAFA